MTTTYAVGGNVIGFKLKESGIEAAIREANGGKLPDVNLNGQPTEMTLTTDSGTGALLIGTAVTGSSLIDSANGYSTASITMNVPAGKNFVVYVYVEAHDSSGKDDNIVVNMLLPTTVNGTHADQHWKYNIDNHQMHNDRDNTKKSVYERFLVKDTGYSDSRLLNSSENSPLLFKAEAVSSFSGDEWFVSDDQSTPTLTIDLDETVAVGKDFKISIGFYFDPTQWRVRRG